MLYDYFDLRNEKIDVGSFITELFKYKDPVLFIKNINKNRMYKQYIDADERNKDIFAYIDQNDLATAKEGNIRFTQSGRNVEIIFGNKELKEYDEVKTKVISIKRSDDNKKYTIPMEYSNVLLKTVDNKLYLITKEQFNSLLERFITVGIPDHYWLELRDLTEDFEEDMNKGYEYNKNVVNGMKNIHLIGTEPGRHSPEYYLGDNTNIIDVEVIEE